jgi:hypothetical protein
MLIDRSITVGRPRTEVYQFWRAFENFPRFMQHLKLVRAADERGMRSHWVAKAPLDKDVEWDAEITADQPNEMIAWRSLPGSQIQNSGTVQFKDAQRNRGTEVYVTLEYDPPGGNAAALVARMLGGEPENRSTMICGVLSRLWRSVPFLRLPVKARGGRMMSKRRERRWLESRRQADESAHLAGEAQSAGGKCPRPHPFKPG